MGDVIINIVRMGRKKCRETRKNVATKSVIRLITSIIERTRDISANNRSFISGVVSYGITCCRGWFH